MFLKKYKARQWVRKISSKNLQTTEPVNYEMYLHKDDKIALSALKKIPLFDTACGKIIELISEPQFNIINMSTKVRITESQCPRIYYMVESISKKLGIEMPDLYLALDREPNAYTSGDKKCFIVVTTGLLECMEDDEIYAVLAHECGHIACHHVLYHTLGRFILKGGEVGLSFLDNNLIGTLLSVPLRLAFYHWQRCSEYSADRAAIICCESAKPVVETMMRLAGGTTHIDTEIRTDLFVEQSIEYKELIDDSKVNKTLEYLLTQSDTHPLLSVRAYEAQEWVKSEEYKQLIEQLDKIPC